MGQGGYITLVNSTDSNWKKGDVGSYQMNSWDFPNKIDAKSSVSVYIEWDQSIFHTSSDDSARVDYQLEGTNNSFQIQATAKNGFELKVCFNNIETKSNKKGSLLSLGWNHDGYVNFVLSGSHGNYTSTNIDGASWMQDNISLLGTKTLKEICITGSHDSGMSVKGQGTPLVNKCNVLTQSKSIHGQLLLGSRYFDIRPVISAGKHYTGHYSEVAKLSWQGANGQSIASIVEDINSFTVDHKELIILNVSHSLNTDVGNSSYRTYTQDEWDELFVELAKIDYRFDAEVNTNLTLKTVNEFISSKSAVIVIIDDKAKIVENDKEKEVNIGTYEGKGFFHNSCFNVYNSYANKNDVDKMASDQLGKMKNNKSEYFLLSWTLTQDATQASTCFMGITSSIEDLAKKANQKLATLVYPKVTKTVFPNILYTDFIENSDSVALAMAINSLILK